MLRSPRTNPPAPLRPRPALVRTAGALLCALVVLGPVVASAQQFEFRGFEERHGRVQREVERTQDLWVEVNSRAGRSNLPGVRDLVEQARRIQVRAIDALRDAESIGTDALSPDAADGHLRQSLTLTLRARDLTTRAARQLREELSQEESARRTIERAKQQLDRSEGADGRLRAQARELVERAETQWRDGRFEPALRLAQNALAVLQSAEPSAGADDAGQIAASLDRLRDRVQRVRERGARGERIDAVERMIARAQDALDAGRTRQAAQQVLNARRALDAVRDDGGSDDSRTERALDRIDAQIERIQERFGDRLDGPAARLLRQAGQARDRAARALADGDEDRAQRHIRSAADLLARLQRLAGRD